MVSAEPVDGLHFSSHTSCCITIDNSIPSLRCLPHSRAPKLSSCLLRIASNSNSSQLFTAAQAVWHLKPSQSQQKSLLLHSLGPLVEQCFTYAPNFYCCFFSRLSQLLSNKVMLCYGKTWCTKNGGCVSTCVSSFCRSCLWVY